MTFVAEQIEKYDECSCCGKKLLAGDGCITYESANLRLALGSCCALIVLRSLIQDAEKAVQSTNGKWVECFVNDERNGERFRHAAEAANGLAGGLLNWAKAFEVSSPAKSI